MTKFAFGKIACLVSAVGTFAALQISAPANAANETAAIVLPAMATTTAAPAAGESVETPSDDAASPANRTITTAKADARQIECVAKVIVHEAGNQPRRGQAAVAQVIRTRSQDPRFGDSACAVVRQPGQFFDVDAYNPPRDDARWAQAVDVATETLNGQGANPVPGALFFHSVGSPMKGRTNLGRIEGHVFYR